MREATLKIKSYAHGVNRNIAIVNNGNLQRRMLHIILVSFMALSLCYLLILSTMIFNIIERKGYQAQERTLSSEVSDLELNYLAMSKNVDLSLGHSLGFTEIKPTFATRKSLGSVGLATSGKNDL
jgi:hypothetical protein